MATPTYESIKTYTFASAGSGFSWTSIPNTYTDLVIVGYLKNTTGNNYEAYITYNGDSGANYSYTFVQNYNGSLQAGQNVTINQTRQFKTGSSSFSAHQQNIFNYANTNVYKTSMGRSGNDDFNNVILGVGYWKNTAAINRIDLAMESGANFAIGSRLDLYGIRAE